MNVSIVTVEYLAWRIKVILLKDRQQASLRVTRPLYPGFVQWSGEVTRGNIAFDPFNLFLSQKEPEILRTSFFRNSLVVSTKNPHTLVRADNKGVQSRCYCHLQTILFFQTWLTSYPRPRFNENVFFFTLFSSLKRKRTLLRLQWKSK